MSFFLPITDYREEKAAFLPPDSFCPELINVLGVSDRALPDQIQKTPATPTSDTDLKPIYALWGGSDRCVSALLSAAATEAANRSLDTFICRDPIDPSLITALRIEGVGLLQKTETTLPPSARLIDLSALFLPFTPDERAHLNALENERDSLLDRCRTAGEIIARLEKLQLRLTFPLHRTDLLKKKASRIANTIPLGGGKVYRLPVSTVTSDHRLRLFPFGGNTRIIGLNDLYAVAPHFLRLLSEALILRGADQFQLTDQWSGSFVGLYLPSVKLCYLIEPPEDRQKLMTLSRYLLSRTQSLRGAYRELNECGRQIQKHLASLSGQSNEIALQTQQLYENKLQKSRFGEFRKRLLIDLFCK